MQNNKNKYAGFWVRFRAAIIDGIIIYIMIIIPKLLSSIIYSIHLSVLLDFDFIGDILFIIYKILFIVRIIGIVVIPWLYFSLMESSRKQATLGKQALSIKVASLNGELISFERATGRYFAKFISNLSLLVGYIMAAFTKKKQALHDTIAGTLVIKA